MSPKHVENKQEDCLALLMEEFAQPSVRRHSDGYQDQETEIYGLEKTIHREAGRPDPRASASRRPGALWRRRRRLRQTPIEMDALQFFWQGHY